MEKPINLNGYNPLDIIKVRYKYGYGGPKQSREIEIIGYIIEKGETDILLGCVNPENLKNPEIFFHPGSIPGIARKKEVIFLEDIIGITKLEAGKKES